MKKMNFPFWSAATAIFVAGCSLFAASDLPKVQPFQPGEQIAMMGDSITHVGKYVADLQLLSALRAPGKGANFFNLGVSGETASAGLKRLDYDVLAANPDRVFVMFGMNDVCRWLYNDVTPSEAIQKKQKKALDLYRITQTELVQKLLVAGKSVILITPSPYDQYGDCKSKNQKKCNEPGLRNCAEIVRALAAKKQLPFVELHHPMTALLKEHPEVHLTGNDRVHPGDMGHLLMAVLIFKSAGYPAEFASVRIENGEAKTFNAGVKNLKVAKDAVTLLYEPQALPLSINTRGYKELDAIYPLAAAINREMLIIKGLAPGKYQLKAAGKVLGEFTEKQFAEGVNLALLDTPSAQIAEKAADLSYQICNNAKKLRGIVMHNRLLRAKGINLEDTSRCYQELDLWLDNQKTRSAFKYYTGSIKQYKKNRPQEEEIMKEAEALRKKLAQIAVPKQFTLEIISLKK